MNYYFRNKERCKRRANEYYYKNREEILFKAKITRVRPTDTVARPIATKESQLKYRREYYKINGERMRAFNREYYHKNREKILARKRELFAEMYENSVLVSNE